ncbi:MAG TPA: hypothetical protein DDW65_01760 [Firmicutes bacterium]|nr:hypothetical protein [Bacillota bacterium]
MEKFFGNRNALGLFELQNDPLFSKIPSANYHQLIDKAWSIGRNTADKYYQQYGTRFPEELVKKLGLVLTEKKQGFVAPQYRICSEYYSNLRQIILYQDTITGELEKLQAKGFIKYKDYTEFRSLFIAHEIFHHIECHDIGLTSKLDKLTVFRLGPWRITSGIRALSEIGAHGFTKALLNLDEETN